MISCLSAKPPSTPIDDGISPDDTALLQYTGGTTGIPKGAVLTHRNLVVNAAQSRAWLTLRNEGEEQIILAVIPFFHVYGMTTAMNLGVLIGAELILLPKFHTKEVLQLSSTSIGPRFSRASRPCTLPSEIMPRSKNTTSPPSRPRSAALARSCARCRNGSSN